MKPNVPLSIVPTCWPWPAAWPVVAGAWQVWPPLAWIVAGGGLIYVGRCGALILAQGNGTRSVPTTKEGEHVPDAPP